jgi:hypothetical protein|tara:strand:- start:1186 stop:2847 length:1662 start_codon:yes stop_codon:yes gene_type:complete
MANEFIIKNGFHSKGDSQVTGSLDVSGAIFSNGSQLGAPFPFTGDAQITGSLTISGSFNAFTLDSDNIVLGSGSGVVMQESANNNVILGTNTADSLTTGDQNVAIGHQALQALTGNSGNTAIGFEAAKSYTNSNSIFIGYRAGLNWSTGNDNVVIGKDAADAHTSGDTNVYIGYSAAGGGVGGGSYNLAIGANSGKNLSTGTNNVALGKNAGLNLNQGTENIAIGTNALDSIAGGEYNIAIGYYAGASLDQDDGNIMIGFGSAADGTTNGELKIGSGSITTIYGDLATGDLTFPSTASADYFAGNGSQLTNLPSTNLASGVTGTLPVANGGTGVTSLDGVQLSDFDDDLSYVDLTTAQTVAGIKTFSSVVKLPNGTKSNPSIAFSTDIDLGIFKFATGILTIASSGQNVAHFNTNGVEVVEGALAVSSTSQAISPSTTQGRIDAANDIVAYSTSDKRLKENITPITNALDKIKEINGVEFDWKELTVEEKIHIHSNEGHDVGVIAQEIEKVLPEVVTTRDNGYKAVKYEKIVPLLIESIKELKAEIETLKKSK